MEKIDSDEAKAGIHGHAWIAEDKETWLKQLGTSEVAILVKKSRPKKGTTKEHLQDQATPTLSSPAAQGAKSIG